MNEPDRLLSPEDVADRLSIKPVTARAWLRTGKLPAVKVGKRGLLRIRASDLDAYIAALEPLEPPAKGKA
jgi:excisionase family DNA binding protein